MATIDLTPEADDFTDDDLGNTVNGGAGNDTIRGAGGDDWLYGQAGDDELRGNTGDDQLRGGGGDDLLGGGMGNDLVVGGAGNDTLIGGEGNDTFRFNFEVLTTTTTLLAPEFEDGVSQGTFSSTYSAWLTSLGSDLNGDGVIDISWSQKSGEVSVEGSEAVFGGVETITVKTGATTHERAYSTTADVTDVTVETNAGDDVINDFTWGEDTLDLNGITQAEFETMFSVVETDANSDGVLDTVVSLNGGGWSVTLAGVSGHSQEDFSAMLFA